MSATLPEGQHIPVMLEPAIEHLNCRPGGIYVDGTVGGGGYTRAILEKSEPDGTVVGLDWDMEAIERVRERLSVYGSRLILEKADYADIRQALYKHNLERVDGIVVDLGLSSYQIEDAERGFSFMQEGPLDMRMDRELPLSAADLVNTLPERELADLIYRYGEERMSRRIARAIATERKNRPIEGTRELAELIRKAVPRTRDAVRIHPATRTFQALRIAVNHELESLERFLPEAFDLLGPGGRLCVVSFHSLEDRIVKQFIAKHSKEVYDRRAPFAPPAPMRLKALERIKPSAAEVDANPRSRSAVMRVAERTEVPA